MLLPPDIRKKAARYALPFVVVAVVFSLFSYLQSLVSAADPTAPSYDFVFSPKTGSGTDATGDGGGGTEPFRLQEYYVGQRFSMTIRMLLGSAKSNGGDARFDIPNGYLNCALDTSVHAFSGNLSMDVSDLGNGKSRYWVVNTAPDNVEYQTGTVNFARLNCTVLKKYDSSIAMLGTTTPFPISWYFTGVGARTDTNIAEFGTANEILASRPEDAGLYLWPDTNKPYIDGFNPANATTNISVTQSLAFSFNDKNPTSGDETGVNKSTLNGTYKKSADPTYSAGTIAFGTCSGIWQSLTAFGTNGNNTCPGSFNPATKIGGNRNYSYNTAYEICFADGKDIASVTQNPPDAAPNTMNSTCTTFTTEADTSKPTISDAAPSGTAASVTDNISFSVKDLKPSTTTYGTGTNPTTISVEIAGKKDTGTPFTLTLTCAEIIITRLIQSDIVCAKAYAAQNRCK
jgi:hypothetical protein